MIASATPNPFPPQDGYRIQVSGGTPPYEFIVYPSPPNPPGVQLTATPPSGSPAEVTVDPAPPTGTPVTVEVRDSSNPPQSTVVINRAG